MTTICRTNSANPLAYKDFNQLPPERSVRFACNGECPKHRFILTPDGEPGLNYLCAGYKLFFKHVDPYMKFMANELRHQRPPANVMSWIRQQEDSDVFTTRSHN